MDILSEIEVDAAIYNRYRSDLLTVEALRFLSFLQNQFAARISQIREDERRAQKAIDQSLKNEYGYLDFKECQAIRSGNWKIGEEAIPAFMKKPGIILVSPADPEMIIKSQTTKKRYGVRPVASMIDFEDAFHLDFHKVMEGQRTLKQIMRGKSKVVKGSRVYQYDRKKDGLNLIRVRINGINTPAIKEILINGMPMERALFDFGLHCFHVSHSKNPLVGPFYVIPKMDYQKALLWADIFKCAEKYLDLPEMSIKCSAIIETLKGDFEIQEVAFALCSREKKEIDILQKGGDLIFKKSHIDCFCSGRHDRVFDMIKVYSHYPEKTYPEAKYCAKEDIGADQSWFQIAEISQRRGIIPVGGMTVALTSDPSTRDLAMKITAESLRKEHDRGSVQAWEAMPDTTPLAMDILQTPIDDSLYPKQFLPAFLLPHGVQREKKLRQIEKEIAVNLRTIPKGDVSYLSIYNNINQAIEYIEAWLRGHGVIPYRQRREPGKPILMQNMATAERARSELWTWFHHKIIIKDENRVFDKSLFFHIVRQVLSDINTSISSKILVKGKMSPKSFSSGKYKEAADLLEQLVLDGTCADTMKFLLWESYLSFHTKKHLYRKAS